ncbi:hypothetical protein KNT64_gp220 [Pseudomonas phage PspYZU05]|uniref:Uncharacterized protein n=1 Tax=Pseudomonas phage PspYZU05 TaxID=1983556 RepID=A0A2U7NS35_9CAUD|nr:hypothetical protein KNT64_gp220 [Pseudomonas phage PspYZU05]ASD52172.1 hypothetical protein PspYZU05_220 [Pseudomonas phage PspYZU05]
MGNLAMDRNILNALLLLESHVNKKIELPYLLGITTSPAPAICRSISLILKNTDDNHSSFDYRRKVTQCIHAITEKWPLHSGDCVYPVPLEGYDSTHAYECIGHLYGYWAGEYGKNRRKLLSFLIENFKMRLGKDRIESTLESCKNETYVAPNRIEGKPEYDVSEDITVYAGQK